MEIKPVRTTRLYEEVVEQIKGLIREGKINPGDKFPSERELAERFAISRSVLREAFRVLESLGLVESKRGGGRYLRDYNQQNIFQPGDNFVNLEKAALLDIAEARRLIETQIIKLAVEKADQGDLEELSRLYNLMKNISEEEYRESDLDLEFHLAVARATHNFALYDLLEAQINLLIDLEQKRLLHPGSWRALCSEHQEILESITARDKTAAGEVMDRHLVNLIKAINEI